MDLESAALCQQHVLGEIKLHAIVTPGQIAELVDTMQQAQEALERLVSEFRDYEPAPLPFTRELMPAE